MKKSIILLLVMLFTGCSIEYNLKIDDDFTETFTISGYNYELYNTQKNASKIALFSQSKQIPDSLTDEDYKNYELYNIKDKSKDNLYSLEYSYNFNINNYNDSNAIKSCYEFFRVTKNDNQVAISTSNKFNCFQLNSELESVTVNITGKYEIIQSNADEVNGKIHTWYITRNDADNKPIIFVYDENKLIVTTLDYFTSNYGMMIFVGILGLLGIIALIFKIKSNKVNKI